MKRGLFTILSALSLVLCVGMMALCIRTFVSAQFDFFNAGSGSTHYGLGTERGAIIGYLQLERPYFRDGVPTDVQIVGMGFRYLKMTSDGMRRYNLVLPFWLLALPCAPLPLAWLLRRLRSRRRKRRNLCASCGYDLRASPDRCPECGTETKVAASATAIDSA